MIAGLIKSADLFRQYRA